mmetsp:Transcript_23417/g.81227  ORF Transcript_23417/g.81227 Transcript_23417/m.81227 type:complete len:331 (-) Transcript_23417:46-1038(-)
MSSCARGRVAAGACAVRVVRVALERGLDFLCLLVDAGGRGGRAAAEVAAHDGGGARRSRRSVVARRSVRVVARRSAERSEEGPKVFSRLNRPGVPQRRGSLEVAQRLVVVPRHAGAVDVEGAHVEDCLVMILRRGEFVEPYSFLERLGHARAVVEQAGEVELRDGVALVDCESVPIRRRVVVDGHALPELVTRAQQRLRVRVPLRRRELVQLTRLLRALLQTHAAVKVLCPEHDLRLGVAFVHVLLHPAHPFRVRRAGRRPTKRAAPVVLQALVGALLANLLAAALVEKLFVTYDWQHVQADGARAAPGRRVIGQLGGLDHSRCRRLNSR